MTEEEARTILREGYGSSREEAKKMCFGACCINEREKEALVTLIYGTT